MKRFLLGVLFAASLCGCVKAANPSFSSFATNHFITNNFLIRARLNPAQFDTNASAITITITNIAGVPGGGTLWTNDSGVYVPNQTQVGLTATNIIGIEQLQALGALMMPATHTATLAAGLNDVGAINRGAIWVVGFDSDPANSSLRLDTGNGQGQILFIQNSTTNSGFTMRNGESLFNGTPDSYQILNGDWVAANQGDSILLYNNGVSWAEIGRLSGTTNNTGSSLWESVAGVLRPLGHSLGTNQFTIAESTGWTGSGTNAFFDNGTFSGVAMINQTDGAIAKRANAYELEDLAAGVGLLNNDGTNNFSWIPISSISDGTNTAVVQLGPFTPGRYPIANGTNTLTDGSFYASGTTNVALDVSLVFGPGDTNSLYRSSKNLVWSNSFGAKLQVNAGTNTASFGFDNGGNTVITTGASSPFFQIQANTNILSFSGISHYIYPYPDNDVSLAGPNVANWWKDFGMRGTAWISGYYNNPALSALQINHGGTNGTITFNSYSSSAGDPVPIALKYNSTNMFQFDYLGNIIFGPGTTNVLYRSGAALVFTNNSPALVAQDSTGSSRSYLSYTNGAAHIGTTASTIFADNSITTRDLAPASGNTYRIGAFQNSNGDYLYTYARTNMVRGFDDGAGNYSFGSFSHSGTNGAAIFDSRSNGTAGSPRNHRFDLGGTNQFSIGDGWIQLMRGMTKAEKATITPTNGMVVYQTDNTPGFRGYVNGAWVIFSTAADP